MLLKYSMFEKLIKEDGSTSPHDGVMRKYYKMDPKGTQKDNDGSTRHAYTYSNDTPEVRPKVLGYPNREDIKGPDGEQIQKYTSPDRPDHVELHPNADTPEFHHVVPDTSTSHLKNGEDI